MSKPVPGSDLIDKKDLNADVLLMEEFRRILNQRSRENNSNTPDFILARYLVTCLRAFEEGIRIRENWYGRETTLGTQLGTPLGTPLFPLPMPTPSIPISSSSYDEGENFDKSTN